LSLEHRRPAALRSSFSTARSNGCEQNNHNISYLAQLNIIEKKQRKKQKQKQKQKKHTKNPTKYIVN
jgi:hypothetical protein